MKEVPKQSICGGWMSERAGTKQSERARAESGPPHAYVSQHGKKFISCSHASPVATQFRHRSAGRARGGVLSSRVGHIPTSIRGNATYRARVGCPSAPSMWLRLGTGGSQCCQRSPPGPAHAQHPDAHARTHVRSRSQVNGLQTTAPSAAGCCRHSPERQPSPASPLQKKQKQNKT